MTADIGFSVRWGGEEFLLGFDSDIETVKQMLETFRQRILIEKFMYEDNEFSISMTFGVVSYTMGEDFEKTIQRADSLLYYGKEHGRNQIVTEAVLVEDGE